MFIFTTLEKLTNKEFDFLMELQTSRYFAAIVGEACFPCVSLAPEEDSAPPRYERTSGGSPGCPQTNMQQSAHFWLKSLLSFSFFFARFSLLDAKRCEITSAALSRTSSAPSLSSRRLNRISPCWNLTTRTHTYAHRCLAPRRLLPRTSSKHILHSNPIRRVSPWTEPGVCDPFQPWKSRCATFKMSPLKVFTVSRAQSKTPRMIETLKYLDAGLKWADGRLSLRLGSVLSWTITF